VAEAIISAGTTPTWATVIAWPQQHRTTVSDQYGIEFQVGPPDRLEASAAPPSLLVGGNSATIRVRVLDCGGNPVTEGTLVTFTLLSGQGSLAPPTATTASGWAFSTLTSPNETGSAVIRVSAGDRQQTLVVDYTAGPPFDVVLSADPLSIPANGFSISNIRADVKDLHGNPVADRTVVVFSTEMGSFETGMSHTTFTEAGSASAVLRSSSTPGIARVEAIAAGKRASPIWVDFYFTPTTGWNVYLPIITKNARRF
jgi:adhesin/invasin